MIKLYDYTRCPFCQKVRIALHEKGIDYERKSMDIGKGDQKESWYLELNPYGKVPVLQDGDVVVYESGIINEYLDERYPDPPLMPNDRGTKAKARMLAYHADAYLHPPLFAIYRELRLKKDAPPDTDVLISSKEALTGSLEYLESVLEGKDFLVGAYSLADVAFTPSVALFAPLGIDPDEKFVNVNKWIERLKQRASFEAVI